MGLLTEAYKAGGTKRYNSRELYDVFQALEHYGEHRTFEDLFGIKFIDAIIQGTTDLKPEHRLRVMWAILLLNYIKWNGISQKDKDFCNNTMINKGTIITKSPERAPKP